MRITSFLSFILLLVACAQTVSRVDPAQQIDLSGRWNDTDSRQVAEKMIAELMASPRYQEYAKELGKRPTIIVGLIRNRTSEHIDANNYIKKFEVAIFNSNVADLVESDTFRDKLREERGANLMLFGEMTSETDVLNKQRVVNYITTLFLTDMETNKRVWYGQHEIKKHIRK
jgi:penicillin-binding protein activator